MQATDTSVWTTVQVDVPIEQAFKVFTEGMGTWWNADHHIIEVPLKEMIFEPHVGGRIYDLGVDGSTCVWARVLAYEPSTRLVFSWDIGLDWKIETDLSKTSEVEVRFFEDGPASTRVELEHRNLDRHGDGWESMRAGVGSANGWPALATSFGGAFAA